MEEDKVSKTEFTCLESHEAKFICGSKDCQDNAFLCINGNCKNCSGKHSECDLKRIPGIIQKLNGKKKKPTAAIKKAYAALQKVYDDAIQSLSIDREHLKDQLENFGYYQPQIQFLKLIQDGLQKQIKGSLVYQVLQTIHVQKQFNVDDKMIKLYWQKHQEQFKNVFDKLKRLSTRKLKAFQSKVTDKTKMIEQFLPHPIFDIKLLYRASQQKYSISAFHQLCDNAKNTIVLAKTQFGKIIGGYTPLSWGGNNSYMKDQSGQTFLFSITKKEKYVCTNLDQAIYCRNDYGPTFGGGHDFNIGQNSNTQRNNSYFSFSNSFNTIDNKYQNDETAYEQFCGAKEGDYYAKIPEWEVFQVQFL